MPATRTARRQDTVSYRDAKGKFRNVTVLADTKAPSQTPASSTLGTGGTLAAATYSYRVTFVAYGVETAPSPAKTQTTTGTTSTVTIDVTGMVPTNASSWKVYGRTGGSELLMGTVTLPTLTFTDTGSVTPSGALPTDSGNISIKLRGGGVAAVQNVAKTGAYKNNQKYFNR